MKKCWIIWVLLWGVCTTHAQTQFETGSTDAIRNLAIKQNKLVFIDLYATWCPPCRTMDREVFTQKEVGEFLEKYFVAVKYDTDKTTGDELLKKYGFGSIPLYLIFDTKGELLGRIQGACDAKTLIQNLQTVLDAQKKK